MKPAAECVACGARFPVELVTEWGTLEETSGYGPAPRCVAIVPMKNTRGVRRGRSMRPGEEPGQVCGAPVRVLEVANNTELRQLRPIIAGRDTPIMRELADLRTQVAELRAQLED